MEEQRTESIKKCESIQHKEHSTIDLSEKVEEDLGILENVVIICRLIGPKFERKKTKDWIENT